MRDWKERILIYWKERDQERKKEIPSAETKIMRCLSRDGLFIFLSPSSDVTNKKLMMKDSGIKCTIFTFWGVESKLFISGDAFKLPLKTSEIK